MKRSLLSGLLAILGIVSVIATKKSPVDDDRPDTHVLDTLRETGAI